MAAATATGVPKPAEGKGNQQRLEAGVAGQISHRCLDDFEFAGFHSDAVQRDRPKHNPGDGKQAKAGAIGGGAESKNGWQLVRKQRHEHRRQQGP
jgi:hypothetical protein